MFCIWKSESYAAHCLVTEKNGTTELQHTVPVLSTDNTIYNM